MAPVAAALTARGTPASLRWLGAAPAPGLAGVTLDGHTDLPADATFAQRTAAAETLLRERPAAVVVAGSSPTAHAVAACAHAAGIPVAHLDAGARAYTEADGAARAIDHLSSLWLCGTQAQATNLLREGVPQARVHTVGTALCAGLDAAPGAGDGRVLLWTAGPQADALRAALQAATAGRKLTFAAATGDLTALVGATAVITDCASVQQAACALRVPCVTTTPFTSRPETVDCGANQIAGPEPHAVARALEIALAGPRDWTSPYAAGAADAATALAGLGATAPAAPTATTPMSLPSDGDWTGRTLGHEECELATRAIRSGTLNSTKGTFVTRFEQEFARATGRKHAIACASGSAAVHCAINALCLQPGDEVITTPITDMGALTCILYEGAVPVFADVDPVTINVTAATLAAQITDRTRAIVVTHLFGLSCDMAPIVQLAKERNLILIEDMAQAFGATERTGRPGTFGAISCYSLQQGKHMTTGEGGVCTTDDPGLARRLFLFVNKAWGYGDPKPDHYFPALNFRLTELQGAVALAQLRKLDWVVERRRQVAAQLTAGLQGIAGLTLPQDPPGGRHSWWKYAFLVDPTVVEGGAVQLGKRMKERGVFCVPRYIQKPAFECELFQDFNSSPVSQMPLANSARRNQPQPLFDRKNYPGTVRALDRVIVLPINELYTKEHVDYVTGVIRSEARVLAHA
ncbi:MAG: DegT/DnrJ/EryC1/StrS family aminotransferase [Planctomycetota bacterium]